MIKRKEFKTSLGHLKIAARTTGETAAKVRIPQIGWDGQPLNPDAVAEQRFILESTGKNSLKLRSAYHKSTPFNIYIENELIKGKTSTVTLPLPYVPMTGAKGEIPATALRKGNKVQNVWMPEAKLVNGKWVKVLENAPLYKQRYTGNGLPFTKDTANVLQDTEGFYIESTSKWNYIAMYRIGLFVGRQVNEAGVTVPNTDGVYMVEGGIDEKYFLANKALKAGSKFSIGSRLRKVLMNPYAGVVNAEDVSASGFLKRGIFEFNSTPVTIKIMDSEGKLGAALVDRKAYKLGKFQSKKTRATAGDEVLDVIATGTDLAKDDLLPTEESNDAII